MPSILLAFTSPKREPVGTYLSVYLLLQTFHPTNHSLHPSLIIEGVLSIQLIPSAQTCAFHDEESSLAFISPKRSHLVPATCVCPSLGANFPPNQSLWCPPSLPTNQCPPCLPTNHRPFLFGPEWFYFRQAEWVLLPGQPASKYRWLAEEIKTRQWSKYQQLVEEIQTRGSFQRGQNKPTFL